MIMRWLKEDVLKAYRTFNTIRFLSEGHVLN